MIRMKWNALLRAILIGCFGLAVLSIGRPGVVLADSDSNQRPVPRFVSLKATEVNARAGPGKRYPVKWKYVRPGLPVEIIAEYETWRKIRDWEGQESWVHRAMLSGVRRLIVTGEVRTLRRRAEEAAPAVVRLEPGMIADVEDCGDGWCRVEVRNYRGWLKYSEVWGVYPGEVVD